MSSNEGVAGIPDPCSAGPKDRSEKQIPPEAGRAAGVGHEATAACCRMLSVFSSSVVSRLLKVSLW